MKAMARLMVLLVLSALPMTAAMGQPFPSKPIRLVVGFPPGGGSDTMARALSQKLSEYFGTQVVVDNKPGANGNIAAELVAKAPGDGYTLLLLSVSHAISVSLYAKLSYDLQKDLVPVAPIGAVPNTLVVHPSVPAGNVAEFISLDSKEPGKYAYASSGSGSPEHLAGELFKTMAGVEMVHTPYKGSGQSVVDLMAGHVLVGFNTMPSIIQQAKSGKLKLLAVTTARRSPSQPEVPTLAESGMAGFDLSTWYGVMAPAGTPQEIINRLNAEIQKALASTEVRDRLAVVGADPMQGSPAEFGAFIKSEVGKLGAVVKQTGARAE